MTTEGNLFKVSLSAGTGILELPSALSRRDIAKMQACLDLATLDAMESRDLGEFFAAMPWLFGGTQVSE